MSQIFISVNLTNISSSKLKVVVVSIAQFIESFSSSCVLTTLTCSSVACSHKHCMSSVLLKLLFFTGRNLISCPTSHSRMSPLLTHISPIPQPELFTTALKTPSRLLWWRWGHAVGWDFPCSPDLFPHSVPSNAVSFRTLPFQPILSYCVWSEDARYSHRQKLFSFYPFLFSGYSLIFSKCAQFHSEAASYALLLEFLFLSKARSCFTPVAGILLTSTQAWHTLTEINIKSFCFRNTSIGRPLLCFGNDRNPAVLRHPSGGSGFRNTWVWAMAVTWKTFASLSPQLVRGMGVLAFKKWEISVY